MENTILLQWGSFAQESNIYCTTIAPVRMRTTCTAWYVSGNVVWLREKRSGQTRHRDITVSLNVRLCRGWRVRTIQTCYFYFFSVLCSLGRRGTVPLCDTLYCSTTILLDGPAIPCHVLYTRQRVVRSPLMRTYIWCYGVLGSTRKPLAHTREWTSAVST